VVAGILRSHGFTVEVHGDHFTDTERDEVWLTAISGKGWIVLSKDGNIRKRELERRAMLDAGVHAFWLGRSDVNATEIAEILRRAIPKIVRLVDNASAPVHAVIRRDASIDVLDATLSVVPRAKRKAKEKG
jgi:hypothetical protein